MDSDAGVAVTGKGKSTGITVQWPAPITFAPGADLIKSTF